ncbi:UROD/MetE-like protein [Acaromyces ingoldii]|uniref:UROD/MetE-like protein n=1 Tax=Acaromyces ingoldii TaxID=215250 RepID=A0A316YQI7_9BASI|nr:UROD/MetE-like protein [Acaromyces ingoldii]PWN91501.1 UROD/MetE-like protein [Acaromyces ingoldii]
MSSTATLPTGSAPTKLASSPPFRHEHVGSFLRPRRVHEARAQFGEGKLDAAALRAVEDEEIAKHIKDCLHWKVRDLSDGEFRRQYFHIDFLKHLEGVDIQKNTLEQQQGNVPPTLAVTSKLRHSKPIEVDNFNYLKSIVPADQHHAIKITIPSPTMLHFRGGRKAISEQAYPNLDDFFADLAQCYVQEVNALYAAGCRYLQLDDTNLAYLTDPKMRSDAEARGEDLAKLPQQYVRLINAAISSAPKDMTLAIHLCKGNFKSQYFAMGSSEGYEPIASALFGELNVDAYFLEWENPERSGQDFSALRHLPETKTVVLGLVSSKTPQLEDEEKLVERIQEASKVVPKGKDQLAISPQCGFSSTVHGNDLTAEEQFKKLDLCRRVAAKVWGENNV